jgi:glycosyltransferase involved in cell wall biosynthesis
MQKVLISSFAVSPLLGSEAGIGWDLSSRIGRHCKATVLYGAEKRTFQRDFSIDRYLSEHGEIPNVDFVWVEATPLAKKMLRLHDKTHLSFIYYWAYALWQKEAYRVARELDKTASFDLVHQFNMIGFREPGYLWKMGKPFVWGPVGGTVNISPRYRKILGAKALVKIMVRNLANVLQLRFSGKVGAAARRSDLIIAASSSEKANLQKRFPGREMAVINETGATPPLAPLARSAQPRLRMVWSGKHLPRKALPFLLYALHKLPPDTDYHVDILGEGSETGWWKALARDLGLDGRVTWSGWLDRQSALERMRAADLFVFTSLKEGTSTVVMEAISLGMPVVCMDVCGMGDVVDQSCGRKVPLEDPERMIDRLRDILLELYRDRPLLAKLAEGTAARARELSWDNKVLGIAALYKKVLDHD